MNAALRSGRSAEEFPLIDSNVETEMPETDRFAGSVPERDGAAVDGEVRA